MTPLSSFLKEERQRFAQRPSPFFSTQMLKVEVESGRAIEIYGRSKENARSSPS
jgi:hypothetical protein